MLIEHQMLKKQEDDKNCEENINRRPVKSKVCDDKKCQATKCYKKIDKISQTSVMHPKKPAKDMWSVTTSSKKKLIGLAKDKNCRAKYVNIMTLKVNLQ